MDLLETPIKQIREKRVTFQDIDWQAFKQIQTLLTERSQAGFIYDRRVLEITTSSERHERFARLIERFIGILVVETGQMLKTSGIYHARSRGSAEECRAR